MSRRELTDSIGRLARELRAVDRNESGVVAREDFTKVLLRSGGSVAQAGALADQFAATEREDVGKEGGMHAGVRYGDLLRSMRELAADTSTSPREKEEENVRPHETRRPIAFRGQTANVVSSSSCRPTDNINNDDRRRRENFYSTRGPASAESGRHRFAIPSSEPRYSPVENTQQHRWPSFVMSSNGGSGGGCGGKRTDFLGRASSSSSSPPFERTSSSVERMLQQAKQRAFSESDTPLRSDGSREEASHEDGMRRSDREMFHPMKREENVIGDARQMKGAGAATMRPSTQAIMMAANDAKRHSVQDSNARNARVLQNASGLGHGTPSSGVAGRGEFISLREVFRVIDTNHKGAVTLREVWNAFCHRGIDISLLEIEALADSLDLGVSHVSNSYPANNMGGSRVGVNNSNNNNNNSNNNNDDSDRVLGVVDFCILVSRMRSSFIERIRRSSIWATTATESVPPPVTTAHNLADNRHGDTEKDLQSLRNTSPLCDFMASPLSPLSPPPPTTPTAEALHRPKQQQTHHQPQQLWSNMETNSFSPPPSVHTSVTVSHEIELSHAGTPRGCSTAAVNDDSSHHYTSGSSVSVSPSPEMEKRLSAHKTPRRSETVASQPSFSSAVREPAAATVWKDKQHNSVLMKSAKSQSPHPHDVPMLKGAHEGMELSVPPSYPCSAIEEGENGGCGTRQTTRSNTSSLMSMMPPQPTTGTTTTTKTHASCDNDATKVANHDYAALHKEILSRQRQLIEDDDFLRRLEQEFHERYGDLINDTNGEPVENGCFSLPVNSRLDSTATLPKSNVRTSALRTPRGTKEMKPSFSPSPSFLSSSGDDKSAPMYVGGTDENTAGLGRLSRPTASSLAHDKKKKFTYCPPKRAASSSTGRDVALRMMDTKVKEGKNTRTMSVQRRRQQDLIVDEGSTSMREGHHITRGQPQQKRESVLQDSVSTKKTMLRGGNRKEMQGGDGGLIRNAKLFSSPRNNSSGLTNHYSPNSINKKPSPADCLEKTGPGVVRVSLVPCEAKNKTTARRQGLPMPGIPPRPPSTSSNMLESSVKNNNNRNDSLQLSREISVKLYGKCSQLLSLCTNYDRSHVGYVSPKDFGRALYTVAQDLSEGEISELVRLGIENGADGTRCHYMSLVKALVVQESYLRPRDTESMHHQEREEDTASSKDETRQVVGGSSELQAATIMSKKRTSPHTAALSAVGGEEKFTLEERVRKGRLKMKRLLREELLAVCDGDCHQLRNVFFVHDDIHTGFLEEKVLRSSLAGLFSAAQRVIPPWVMDRCVRLCRTPFEREMMTLSNDQANDDDGNSSNNNKISDKKTSMRGRKKSSGPGEQLVVVAPPPESEEEAAARRRVHGIPKLLWSVLCDYRYLLEELRL